MTARAIDPTTIKQQIAVTAAKLIAEDGATYENAKRQALRMITGNTRINSEILPNNEAVENELRRYNRIFHSKTQLTQLKALRLTAVALMRHLADFSPYITGAVLNGTANEHSTIHLQLFADNAKDVQLFLLNEGIPFEVGELDRFRKNNRIIETVTFNWRNETIQLTLYEPNDLRRSDRYFGEYAKRADLAYFTDIINGNVPDPADA
jgi:hypothetical protein